VARAEERLAAKDPKAALELFRKAWDAGRRTPGATYDAACAASQSGLVDESAEWLLRASAAGYHDVVQAEIDPDLGALHESPRWPAVLARLQADADEELRRDGATDVALRHELAAMVKVDQVARARAIATNFKDPQAIQRMFEVDAANLPRLRAVLEKHGWPGKHLVGAAGSSDAWLLVQHMDKDPAFQRRALDLMVAAAASGEASRSDAAYLTDRVLLAEGKPQRYGTQFEMVEGVNVPKVMEDPEGVDRRRDGVGLGTMAEYAERMSRTYGIPARPVRPPSASRDGG
jgi:hypothetical protein